MKNHLFSRPTRVIMGSGALAMAAMLGTVPAFAQPDVNNGPKADNPANRAVGVQLTPEQRIEQRFRRQLLGMGLNQVVAQDAIIAYTQSESKARVAIALKGLELQNGLRGNALTDAQATSLLNDYLAAIEEDKDRRTKAEADLLKTVDLTKFPKVESMLVLMGVYGNGPVLMSAQGNNVRGGNTALFGGQVAAGAPGDPAGIRPEVGAFGALRNGIRENLGGFGQVNPGLNRVVPQAATPVTPATPATPVTPAAKPTKPAVV